MDTTVEDQNSQGDSVMSGLDVAPNKMNNKCEVLGHKYIRLYTSQR